MTNLKFNKNQQFAIEYCSGPLLIVAGAGTGKTFTLVEKIKYLVLKKIARPEEILCLTFTEKAAYEMEERIDQAMPYGYFQMTISTFHAFADEVLREEAAQIGLDPGYRLLSKAESILFLRQHLFEFRLKYFRPLGNPTKFIEGLLQHFSRLRDEDISPKQYLSWVKKQQVNKSFSSSEEEKYHELSQAYDFYQTIKVREGVLDFSDLIFYLLKLYRHRPNVLHENRSKFRFILVDEFQDTNIAQYELIKLLAPPTNRHGQLTVVGDDSQAIYKFRGASVSNILSFMSDYPQARKITLNTNYRSNQTILDLSYRLIKHNDPDTLEFKLGISKKLISMRKSKDNNAVVFTLTNNVDEEAELVAKTINQLIESKSYRYSDIAILVRANDHIHPFLTALNRYGIPYQFLGPGVLFHQPEVKDLIAYLKLLSNLDDSVSCYRILSMPIFGIDSQDLSLIVSFSKRTGLSLYQASEILASFFNKEWLKKEYKIYQRYLPLVSHKTRDNLVRLIFLIKRHLRKLKVASAGQLLFMFLEESGLLQQMTSYQSEKEEKQILNINKFFSKLKNFEFEKKDNSVYAVVEYLEMCMELGESPMAEESDRSLANAVNILTVHSAKGLEFSVVFLVNLTKNRFPTINRREQIPIPIPLIKEILPQGDYHLQEERRLFYVGLTRAKDRVYLSASLYYGERKTRQRISPFVVETLGEEAVNNAQLLQKELQSQLSIFDFRQIEPKIISEPLTFRNFSYSQLELYKLCPLQYRYQYILKIPTLPNAAASFGESIHRALQKFYQLYLANRRIGEKDLLNCLFDEWVPIGYSSREHEKRLKQEGALMLQGFFQRFHSDKLDIIGLEQLFKLKLADDIFISGKIDRVDRLPSGEIEIIDYKTGRKPDEKDSDENLQLSIYALAAISPALYNAKIEKVVLSFYYLQEMERVSIKQTPCQLERVKTTIQEIVSSIKTADFKPKVGPWCDFCPFRMICEAWR